MNIKKLYIILAISILVIASLFSQSSNVGIGTTSPDASAALDVTSNNKGFLPPRMFEGQRDAISSPSAGLIVYCTDCSSGGEIQFFNGTTWRNMLGDTTKLPDVISNQTVMDITDFQAGGLAGYAVSISEDGTRIIVGTPFGGANTGEVFTYDFVGTNWVPTDTITGNSSGDKFGYSVSISNDGNRIAIGAPFSDHNGTNSGSITMYEWDGTNWVQMGTRSNGETGGQRGLAVSISGDGTKVAMSTPLAGTSDRGIVSVHAWNGTEWQGIGGYRSGEQQFDHFGTALSLSYDGNRLAIGTPLNDGNGSSSGQTRVYDWNEDPNIPFTGTWVKTGLDIDGEASEDKSGSSVSLSGDGNRIAIGAKRNDGNGANSGHVRVYNWNGISWIQTGSDIDGENSSDESGVSVSLSSDGNLLAIGASKNAENGVNSGSTRIFRWNGISWVQSGLDFDGSAINDYSGLSVALSKSGNRIIIGAPYNDTNGTDAGQVKVFE